VITVTLTNYYHNDYHIEGTQTIKNMGHNSAGHLVFNVIVSGATVTNPAGTAHSTGTPTRTVNLFQTAQLTLMMYT